MGRSVIVIVKWRTVEEGEGRMRRLWEGGRRRVERRGCEIVRVVMLGTCVVRV